MTTERILVVDDEDSIREIVCSMLGSAGYATTSAGSGIEALGILESGEQFALMLTDMMMAGMEGLELLERRPFEARHRVHHRGGEQDGRA